MRSIRHITGRVFPKRMPLHVLLLALVLTCIGAAFIRSAHHATYAYKHLVFAGIGCVAFVALSLFDYRHLRGIALPLYGAGVLALAGLPFLGVVVNNARRWYDLGLFHAQPSEPMKYLLVIALADYFRMRPRRERLRDMPLPLALTVVPMLLIVIQPDFGTALILLPVFFGMAFLGGVKVRNLAILAVGGCVLLAAAWLIPGALKDYQKERVMGFIDPARNPDTPAAYNARQATIAISAGGLKGQGWGQGVLNRLGRVPERHTDFIFPVVAEEWGFVRTAPLILLYLLVVFVLAQLARTTREPFGRLLIGGVLIVFAVQSLLHMAISLRLAPITGLTLPLISYGGSSLVSTYAGLGLAASVRMHRSIVFAGDEPSG